MRPSRPLVRALPLAVLPLPLLAAVGCQGPLGDVSGSATEVLVADSGVEQTLPWSGRAVQAIVGRGADERTLEGDVDELGSFRIPGVPDGPYWLAFPDEVTALPGDGRVFFRTAARRFDLSTRQAGLPSASDSPLRGPVRLSGLAPSERDDRMQLSTSSGRWTLSWGIATVGSDQSISPPNPIITTRRDPGERVIAAQWRTSLAGGVEWGAVVRAASVAAPDDSATGLDITLVDTPVTKVVATIDHDGFQRALAPAAPATLSYSLSVTAERQLADRTVGGALALLQAAVGPPAAALSLDEHAFVDAGPRGWARRYRLRYGGSRPYDGPGGQASCSFGLHRAGDIAELGRGPLRPSLSLPTALTVGGQGALDTPFTASPAATVRWQAPASGRADSYLLKLVELSAAPRRSQPAILRATFITTDPEVVLPQSVLTVGATYYLEVVAVSGDTVDPAAALRQAVLDTFAAATSHLCSAPFRVE